MSDSLWNFALWLYRQPGVEALCLEWQDRRGANVPLLLCYAWLDNRGTSLNPKLHERLEQEASHWQKEIITPLRQVRRIMKQAVDAEPLRERIKACELDAEKTLLERLENLVIEAREVPPANVGLCREYLHRLGLNDSEQQAFFTTLHKAGEFQA